MSNISVNGNAASGAGGIEGTAHHPRKVEFGPVFSPAGPENDPSPPPPPVSSRYSDKHGLPLGEDDGAGLEAASGQDEAALITPADHLPELPFSTKSGDQQREEASEKMLDPRPKIPLSGPGRLISDLSKELGQVLAPHGIYNRSKIAVVYNRKSRTLEPLTPVRFRSLAENYVIPTKVTSKGEVEQSMSSGDASSVLASDRFLDNLREVERLNTVRLPVMRADGRVELLGEGYDRESKVLTAPEGVAYATDMPLTEATAFLDDLLKDFPFADDGRSKAISLAAMITMVSLELMPPRTIQPVFLYRGNVPGLGKGLLAQAAIIPRLDYAPTGAMPKNEEEMHKLLLATALEGREVVVLDNVTGRLASPNLEGFVTCSTYAGRVLNHSRTVTCEKNTVVFITGNDVRLSGDMARRTMIAELYLASNPGDRVIENHLDEQRLRGLRPRTLGALHALIREWAAAGKPKPTKINPNFVVWSQVVGGIVAHAGYGEVTAQPAAAAAADPREADMFTLVEKLYEVRQTEALKFQQLVTIARAEGLFAGMLQAGGGGSSRMENTAFSRFLTAYDQRMFPDELRFVIIGTGHARRYSVQRLVIRDAEGIGA